MNRTHMVWYSISSHSFSENSQPTDTPAEVQMLLLNFADIFTEPQGLPPPRSVECGPQNLFKRGRRTCQREAL
ncbi:hypothetical protein AQUCO_01100019v1 [Aquilegia coerulea]|uniref:Uncharacterized protein n=1 Tax=Aquilegia coerulea TaxID=218851 RepID=A0A2G5E564_AQUCA|nr:hypothetical protein AQUCO_01100019v1 [Aquilegia coerulea]